MSEKENQAKREDRWNRYKNMKKKKKKNGNQNSVKKQNINLFVQYKS